MYIIKVNLKRSCLTISYSFNIFLICNQNQLFNILTDLFIKIILDKNRIDSLKNFKKNEVDQKARP